MNHNNRRIDLFYIRDEHKHAICSWFSKLTCLISSNCFFIYKHPLLLQFAENRKSNSNSHCQCTTLIPTVVLKSSSLRLQLHTDTYIRTLLSWGAWVTDISRLGRLHIGISETITNYRLLPSSMLLYESIVKEFENVLVDVLKSVNRVWWMFWKV